MGYPAGWGRWIGNAYHWNRVPAQQALFLAAWQAMEEPRPQNAPEAEPLTTPPPEAGFALASENLIRVTERHGDSTTLSTEPAPAAEPGPPAAVSPAASGAAPGAPRVARLPYTDLRLQLFTAPDQRREVDLPVATPQ